MAAADNDGCSATHKNEVSIIKYYLDEFERKDIKTYTTDHTRPAPSIANLITLYNTLSRSHVYFRLKVAQDLAGKGIMPLGDILFNFFTRHVYTSKRDFQIRYPCLSQMISEALSCSVSKEDAGGTTVSPNSTE